LSFEVQGQITVNQLTAMSILTTDSRGIYQSINILIFILCKPPQAILNEIDDPAYFSS